MKRVWYRVVFVGLVVLATLDVHEYRASSPYIPLEMRVEQADLIVTGKLVDVGEFATIEYLGYFSEKSRSTRLFYDAGDIVIEKVLKFKTPAPGYKTPGIGDKVRLAYYHSAEGFASSDRKWKPLLISNYESLKQEEGDHGIWLLHRPVFLNAYGIKRWDNFLPIDSLDAVQRAIESTIK